MTQGKVDRESQAWSEEELFISWIPLYGDIWTMIWGQKEVSPMTICRKDILGRGSTKFSPTSSSLMMASGKVQSGKQNHCEYFGICALLEELDCPQSWEELGRWQSRSGYWISEKSQQPALMCVNNPELVRRALGHHLQLLWQNYKEDLDLEEESWKAVASA